MAKTRGGSTSAPQSSHRAASVRAPLDAPPYLPDFSPQSRYYTRRTAATPVAPTQIPARRPPTKKAKTSEPGESSRAARDSQSQPLPTRRPILASSPIEGNSDYRARAFHEKAYFDHYVLRQQPELGDSYRLLERQIAEASHIPYAPADLAAFRRWAPLSEWDMHSLELPEPREIPPQPLPSIFAPSTSTLSESVPEAASSDAPPAIPPTPEPPITIPSAEYRDLIASFQTLTTTQKAIMERMDHFQLRQDQQTLILQPFASADDFDPADDATPVAVPSTPPPFISAMAKTRGGLSASPSSPTPRPQQATMGGAASPPVQAPAISPSERGTPSQR
ncbi:SH3 domain-containing protein C23A1.17 [Vitis vinifera]|uniref:SH3 domain-containing protein C23A1.17 n=1 Tax=Vitis vinifera TaxID=29760 RepID=UPI00053FA866|nr:SH3 domain-containing protein C23A1.17 [Vitis vinifera]|eukprot:XP_010665017.1 PREDICTED: SH3 domain-containing protein C23A1.17-like [Vitis vinifera]